MTLTLNTQNFGAMHTTKTKGKDTRYFKHAVNMSLKLSALAPSVALPPASMQSCTRIPAGDGLKLRVSVSIA